MTGCVFDGGEHQVVALAGTSVRLRSADGGRVGGAGASSDGLRRIRGDRRRRRLPTVEPFGLLDSLPERRCWTRPREWERHVVEVETGLPPDAPAGAAPRPDYDPATRTLAERDRAKAAELRRERPYGAGASGRRYAAAGAVGSGRSACGREWRGDRAGRRPAGRGDPGGDRRRDGHLDRDPVAADPPGDQGGRGHLRAGRGAAAGQDHVLQADRRAVGTGRHTFGSAVTRRQTANRPPGVFTPTHAARPGEQVQIDSTPIDVMVLLDDGVPVRADLTIAVDVATRTICAAVLRPVGTKAVDAALLLARMLVPEPMRPGWSTALRMSASRLPHARLVDIDARMELAAARPVIVPGHDRDRRREGVRLRHVHPGV